jgi:AraC-like DNA-binding protein
MTEPREDAEALEVKGAWLTGPHERPIINQSTGETHAVGAVFHAGGIGAFVAGPIDAITNRILPMDQVATSLVPQGTLNAETDPDAAIESVSAALVEAMAPPADHLRWSGAIEQLVCADGGSVAEAQDAIGVSRRHFAAQIQQRVGLRPKSLQRIARMRRLLEDLDARKPVRWSQEAVGAGYFDQPHAIRDFRMFTGMTPTDYIDRRREAWGHDVEPGEATASLS